MGDIADMMLEGQMCQGCSEILGDGDGYPTFCKSCQKEMDCDQYGEPRSKRAHPSKTPNVTSKDGSPLYRPGKVNCPTCNKLVKVTGLEQHTRDVHGSDHD